MVGRGAGADAELLERLEAALGVSYYRLWQLLGLSAAHSGHRWLGAASGRRPGQEVLLRLTELLVRELEEAHAVQVRAVSKEDN